MDCELDMGCELDIWKESPNGLAAEYMIGVEVGEYFLVILTAPDSE
jgi:hypothetical protein